MNALAAVPVVAVSASLPALIDRAVSALTNARSAAEVLEARDLATLAYDAAKRAARLGKAKQAHDELIAAAYRAQADALEIEAQAKRRLADEYDAAQERGEIPSHGGNRGNQYTGGKFEESKLATIPGDQLRESRIIRDAEKAAPGIVRRTVDEALAAGEEPTKAKVRRAVLNVVGLAPRPVAGREAICSRVREAIVVLAGLPPAAEVARYFAGTDGGIIINERLKQAVEWIEEFSTAWGGIDHARQD